MASSKREKELARQRAERQAARRAAAAKRRKQRNAVIASVVAVSLVALGAVGTALAVKDGGRDTASASGTPEPGVSPAPLPPGSCRYDEADAPGAKEVKLPPAEGVELKKVYEVTVATNVGDVVFEMDSAKAPCTANSLRSLAGAAFFDGTPCHRLTTQGIKVLQCGDPTGTGSGGPGYRFADENLEGATYPRGTVAMANSGPDTNGSQFFLVYGDSTLPPSYTPFGRITKGLDVLDRVAKAGSDDSNGPGDGKPKTAVTIASLRATARA